MKSILVFLSCLLISGCGLSEQTTAEIVDFLVEPIGEVMLRDEIEYIDNLSDEIIRCFDEKDSDSLEALFCLNVQKNMI